LRRSPSQVMARARFHRKPPRSSCGRIEIGVGPDSDCIRPITSGADLCLARHANSRRPVHHGTRLVLSASRASRTGEPQSRIRKQELQLDETSRGCGRRRELGRRIPHRPYPVRVRPNGCQVQRVRPRGWPITCFQDRGV
jgi:hypothetical protein